MNAVTQFILLKSARLSEKRMLWFKSALRFLRKFAWKLRLFAIVQMTRSGFGRQPKRLSFVTRRSKVSWRLGTLLCLLEDAFRRALYEKKISRKCIRSWRKSLVRIVFKK